MKWNIAAWAILLLLATATAAQDKETIAIKPPETSVQPREKVAFMVALVKDGKVQSVLPWDFAFSASRGTFSGNVYTAPEQPGTYIVFVRYQKLVGMAVVNVKPPEEIARLELTPPQVALQPGEKCSFQAKVYGVSGKLLDFLPAWGGRGGKIDQEGNFVAGQEAGKFEIVVIAGKLQAKAGVEVRVAPPQLTRLEITPANDRVQAGESLPLRVQGYDSQGNPLPVEIVWQATGGAVRDGVYVAGREAGKFAVVARAGDIEARCEIEVTPLPPVLTRIELKATADKVIVGEKLPLMVQGYDQYGKPMSADVKWQATGGVVTSPATFTAGREPGKFAILASCGDLQASVEVEIVMAPGVLSRIEVLPAAAQLQANDKASFRVQGYDQYGKPMPTEVIWQATGGEINQEGTFIAGVQAGKFVVSAAVPNSEIKASSEVTVIVASGYRLRVSPAHIVATPGQKIKYEVAVYHNEKEVWAWPWEFTFVAASGNFDDMVYTAPAKPGVYQIRVRHPQASAVVTVEVSGVPPVDKPQDPVVKPVDKPQDPVDKPKDVPTIPQKPVDGVEPQPRDNKQATVIQILVEPMKMQLRPREKMRFKVTVNKNGTPMWLWPWELECTTSGGIFRDFTYTAPEQEGEYHIHFRYAGVTTTATALVKKTDTDVHEIHVVPPKIVLQAGQQQLFQAYGYDRNGKMLPSVDVSWSAQGGEISPSGIYRAGKNPGNYEVVATAGNLTQRAEVQILSPVVRLIVVPTVANMKPYEQKMFKAIAYLRNGDMKEVAVKWSAQGGEIAGNGMFVAGTIAGQNYAVEAYHELSGIRAQAQVTIETDQPLVNLQISPQNLALSPGQQQQFLLQGFDLYGRSLPVTARWFATGGTINDKGVYTAGSVAGNFEVTAIEARTGLASRAKVMIVAAAVAKASIYQLGEKWGNFLRQGEISVEEMREYFQQELFLKPPQQIQEFQQGFARAYGKGGRPLVLQVWQRAVLTLGSLYGERYRQNEIGDSDMTLFLQKYVVRLSYFEQETFRKGFLQGYKNEQATLLYERLWNKAFGEK